MVWVKECCGASRPRAVVHAALLGRAMHRRPCPRRWPSSSSHGRSTRLSPERALQHQHRSASCGRSVPADGSRCMYFPPSRGNRFVVVFISMRSGTTGWLKSCSAHHVQSFVSMPGNHSSRATAVVIWLLSRRAALAHVFFLGTLRTKKGRRSPLGLSVPELVLAEWLLDPVAGPAVKAALRRLDHPVRMRADRFLVESVLVEYIRDQNSKGLTVDLAQAIVKYLALWTCRPCPIPLAQRLSRLVWDRGARKRFGRDLRRTWGLSIGALRWGRELSHDIICVRVNEV